MDSQVEQADQLPVQTRGSMHTFILGAGAAICAWLVVAIGGYPIGLLPLLLAFFLFATLIRAAFGVYAFLGMVLFFPLLPRQIAQFSVNAVDVFFALALAGLVSLSFRLIDLHHHRLRWPTPKTYPNAEHTLDTAPRRLRPLSGRWYQLLVAVSVALLVLWLFPVDRDAPGRIGLIPSAGRALYIIWFLAFVWLVAIGFFSLMTWRRMDPNQAGVYIRSELGKELSDLASIEKRRASKIR